MSFGLRSRGCVLSTTTTITKSAFGIGICNTSLKTAITHFRAFRNPVWSSLPFATFAFFASLPISTSTGPTVGEGCLVRSKEFDTLANSRGLSTSQNHFLKLSRDNKNNDNRQSMVTKYSISISSSGGDSNSNPTMASDELVRLDFEVFGRVQGVFFRKYTQSQGQSLGLRGFCRNTYNGTVSGSIEGPRDKVELMKRWLGSEGSPQSKIDRVEFKNEKPVTSYSFKEAFGIERTI